jgi:hypothetical protein
MGWKATGEDRVRSFRLYQELEAQYREAQAIIEEQRIVIAALARQLASVPGLVAAELAQDTGHNASRMPQESFSAAKLPTQPSELKSRSDTDSGQRPSQPYQNLGRPGLATIRPHRRASDTVVKSPTLQDIFDATERAKRAAK